MNDQNLQHFNGQPMKIIVSQCQPGEWQSKVELDLGRTGLIVFEDSNMTYPSEEAAREAAVSLAVQNLSRSRIGKSHT